MKPLLVLFVICLVTTSAFAVIDPDPNLIGIYFDISANENCLFINASIPFNAYLILTNTTALSIGAYEVGYRNEVPPGMESLLFRLSSTIADGIVTGLDLGDSSDILEGDNIVGLAEPLVTSPATVLHSWQYMILSPTVTIEMFVTNSYQPSIPGPYPVILDADTHELFQAYHWHGDPDFAVATVNIDCAYDMEEVGFGSVKALYR